MRKQQVWLKLGMHLGLRLALRADLNTHGVQLFKKACHKRHQSNWQIPIAAPQKSRYGNHLDTKLEDGNPGE